MMSEQQRIFAESYVDKLYGDVKSGASIDDYFKTEINIDAKVTMPAQIVVNGSPPLLESDPGDDIASAIAVYEYLGPLNATQASDKRLWTYLSHVTFREYTMQRWKIDDSDKQKSTSSIVDHWFVSENDRRLRRHAIARLWWAANLTVAPWESDPTNFVSLKHEDKYLYTRALLSKQDIFLNVLERSMGRSKKILLALLEIFRTNPLISEDREAVRNLIKEVNLILGYRKLSYLPYPVVANIVASLVTE